MPAKKSQPTKQKPDNPIQVIKEARCKSLEGSAHLTYQVGADTSGHVHLRIAKNTGGGFFSDEWVAFDDIQAAFKVWPKDKPITSMTLRPLFRGKSVNTPSFMIAVLRELGLLEAVPERKRVHQTCDPAPFLASLKASAPARKKKAARKTPAKAKAKTASRKKAPAKSPRKRSPASKKKT